MTFTILDKRVPVRCNNCGREMELFTTWAHICTKKQQKEWRKQNEKSKV